MFCVAIEQGSGRRGGNRIVQGFFKVVMGDFACLFEPRHSFSCFDVYIVICV